MSFCCCLESEDPVPPRPVPWTARCKGVAPLPFSRRGSAPLASRALTADAQRVRTALCKGVTPLLSAEFGSAPTSMRYSTMAP